ncbi:MAG: dynamin family protein [Candidatus Hydrothermia bacterium]|jgi:small GTP-binding protein
MVRDLEIIKNNILFLKNEYLEKLCDVALDVVKRDKIEVVFVGKLSTGKTTIINALLGKDLLPTGIGTITKSITTILKSDENKLEVIYDNGVSEFYSLSDVEVVNQKPHLKALNVHLVDFPFSSIVFIDTPGFDELKQDLENLTLSRIPTADAVIFVLDITKGLTKKDKEFFDDYVIKFLRDKIFIVFNKLDIVKDEVSDAEIQKIKNTLGDFSVFVVSAKEKDENFQEFKQKLFDYLSETSKTQIIKNRISSIIKTIEDVSRKQLSLIIENRQKTKEELEEKLNALLKKKAELDKILNELRKKVDETIYTLINERINPLIEQKRIEIINRAKQVDPDNLKNLLTFGLKNEIQSLLLEIKSILRKDLEFDISSEVNLGFSSFIISIVDFIGRAIDPLLSKYNVDLTDLIQNFIRTITFDIITNDINKVFNKLKESVISSIEKSKNEYFEELKLREYANIDSEIVSVEKGLEFLGKDKEEVENEIKFYENKIKVIQELVNNIRSYLENKVF